MPIQKGLFDQNYIIISNQTAQDESISWAARGLLTYLLSLPDDWNIYIKDLVKRSPKCGKDKLRTILCELESAGYLVKEKQSHSENGQFDGNQYFIYPVPNRGGKTGDGSTATVNPPLQSKERTKETLNNISSKKNNDPDKTADKTKYKFTNDDMTLVKWMYRKIKDVNKYAPEPNLNAWAQVIRLARERDHRTLEDLSNAFAWANHDDFWQDNIQSPEKLRKHFARLMTGREKYIERLNRNTQSGNSNSGQNPNGGTAVERVARALQEQQQHNARTIDAEQN